MTVLIKDPDADRAIRRLAARTGETLTEAVRIAADERFSRLPKTTGRIDRAELERVLTRIRSYPTANEHLTDDEIIGYDENGLPS